VLERRQRVAVVVQRPEDVLVGAVDVLLNDGFVSHLRANSVRVEDLGGAEVVGRFGDVGLPGPNESTYSSTKQVVPGLDDPIGVPVDRVLEEPSLRDGDAGVLGDFREALAVVDRFQRVERRDDQVDVAVERIVELREDVGALGPVREYRSHLRPGGDTQQRVPCRPGCRGTVAPGPPRRSIATR